MIKCYYNIHEAVRTALLRKLQFSVSFNFFLCCSMFLYEHVVDEKLVLFLQSARETISYSLIMNEITKPNKFKWPSFLLSQEIRYLWKDWRPLLQRIWNEY